MLVLPLQWKSFWWFLKQSDLDQEKNVLCQFVSVVIKLWPLSLSLLLVLCFRGGGWQGFAALPQPALLQGLSGPRPPANHQRQPLPPHCSLWVHITLYRSPLPPSGLHHCCTPLLFLFLLFFDLILSAASLYVCNCLFHSLAPFLGYHCQPSSTS